MHGQTTWVNDNTAKRPDNLRDYRQFKGNMDLKKAMPVADVALLFSTNSRDFGGGFNYTSELMGTAQTLGSMHVPYNIVGEMNLSLEALSKYKVLVLGCSSALKKETVEIVKKFAENGGIVYLTTTAGWENEFGMRDKWAFYDVFGYDINRGFSRPNRIIDPETNQPVKLNFQPYYSHPDYAAGTRPTKSLLWGINDKDQKYPLMIEKKYGKGTFFYQPITLAFHLNAPEGYVGKKFDFQIDPWLDKTFRNLLSQIIGDAAYWSTNAPDLLLTTIYRQDNETIIHFLNAMAGAPAFNTPVEYGVPEPAFPPLQEDVTFTIPCVNPARVYAVSPDFDGEIDLKFTVANGKLTATLPKQYMYVYTLVKIAEK